jgi:S-adenosylmethionine decarboxylase proenzyme
MDRTFAGRHVMIDAYVEDAALLRDGDALAGMLKEIASILGMQIIDGPYQVSVAETQVQENVVEFQDTGGLSGFCVISTSHLSFHSWPEYGYISLDIYSCKDYEAQKAIDFLNKFLKITQANVSDVIRRKPYLG